MQCIILVSSWARVLSSKTQVLDIYIHMFIKPVLAWGKKLVIEGWITFWLALQPCYFGLHLSFFKITDDRIRFFTKKLKWNSFSYQIKELVYPMVYIQKKFKNSFKVSCNLLISTLKSIPVVRLSTKCAFSYTIIIIKY